MLGWPNKKIWRFFFLIWTTNFSLFKKIWDGKNSRMIFYRFSIYKSCFDWFEKKFDCMAIKSMIGFQPRITLIIAFVAWTILSKVPWRNIFCKLKKTQKTWISFFAGLKNLKKHEFHFFFFASLKNLKNMDFIFCKLAQPQKTWISFLQL